MTPELPSELRLQLQAATREINWTYSAFWKPVFVNQKKILVWGDGYYNGAIKTFKTTHGRELTPEELGLQRSQQLRDLCVTLLDSNTRDQQASKPFALKVDDLADPEWFFLLSMIYKFAEHEGMVGRTAASGRYAWLRNAHEQETADFTRSLPAKSSSIKTVVCIPLKNGVLEFGTSDDVPDDSELVQSILAFFLEPLKRMPSENTVSSERKRVHSETTRQKLVCVGHRSQLESSVARSPKRVKRSSSSIAEAGEAIPPTNGSIHVEPSCEGPRTSKRCEEFKKGATRPNAFHAWKKSPAPLQKYLHPEKLQWILKGALFRVPGIIREAHEEKTKEVRSDFVVIDKVSEAIKSAPDLGCSKLIPSSEDINANHMLAERRRREKLREKFTSLSTLVPNVTKMDKASILGGAIEYVKELESRLKALEKFDKTLKHNEFTNGSILDTNTTKQHLECTVIEQVKDGSKATIVECVEDKETYEQGNIQVLMKNDVALVNLQCPWNQTLLLNVLQTLNDFEFEVYSVRSSTSNGIFSFLSQAKAKSGRSGSRPTTIEVKKGLQRVAEGNFSGRASASSLE